QPPTAVVSPRRPPTSPKLCASPTRPKPAKCGSVNPPCSRCGQTVNPTAPSPPTSSSSYRYDDEFLRNRRGRRINVIRSARLENQRTTPEDFRMHEAAMT